MNADHDFLIGKDHIVCQDYALSGATDKIAYAIVCDGCSGSPDVDFGARALALAARETLRLAKDTGMDYKNFGNAAIRRADTMMALFPTLHPQYLDSTLLIAWVYNDKLTAYIFGDGMFYHKSGPTARTVHIEFSVPKDGTERSMPDYLSYELDPQNKETYIELGGVKKVSDCIFNGTKTSGTERPMRTFDPVVITAPVVKGDVISLCSDGINSFKEGGVREIPWQEMFPYFADFKHLNGVFVRRTLRALSRECAKKQWAHSDDISLAAIAV
jgi:Protein phosphatase 2C